MAPLKTHSFPRSAIVIRHPKVPYFCGHFSDITTPRVSRVSFLALRSGSGLHKSLSLFRWIISSIWVGAVFLPKFLPPDSILLGLLVSTLRRERSVFVASFHPFGFTTVSGLRPTGWGLPSCGWNAFLFCGSFRCHRVGCWLLRIFLSSV